MEVEAGGELPPPVQFQTAVMVPSQTELQLTTVTLVVAAFPSKAGSPLMRALGPAAPLADLRHLKRVRKAPDDGSLLEAILCPLPRSCGTIAGRGISGTSQGAPDSAADTEEASTVPGCPDGCTGGGAGSGGGDGSYEELAPERLPEELQALYAQHGGVRLRIMPGAAVPPQTRSQWEAWTKLWPITWRIPEHGAPVTEEMPVDERTQRYFEHHMRRALRLAADASADNAAVIVGPPSLAPVAEAVDGSAVHPLQHAVMVAIQVASERDLALWPPAADGEDEGGNGAGVDVGLGAGGEGPQGAVAGMGLGLEGGGDGTASRASGSTGGEDELASKRPRLGEQQQVAAAQAVDPAQASEGVRPYMCTGYDCFVVREPCIMCAMGMVHSRVQRVVYCQPDSVYGAVGGCRRLHACRSLNHNYEVFRMELRELAGAEGPAAAAGPVMESN